MREIALNYIKVNYEEEYKAGNYHLGFHVPWATMIHHLHMHILVGHLTIRGNIEFNRFLYRSVDTVIESLAEDKVE